MPNLNIVSRIRYQCSNHLGSAMLELDEFGAVISYEEYHPYGTSAYHATTGSVEVSPKRYRYTGKERDEETGLYYHGARYYACWLARWTSADPAGMVDGPNLFQYVRGRPIGSFDPTGKFTAGCTPVPDPSQTFLEEALRIKGLQLRRAPLDTLASLNPSIERQSANSEKIAAATLDDGKTIRVAGKLADVVHTYARQVSDGTAGSEAIDRFAQSMGVLYHEGTHADLWPRIGTPSEPSWYAGEVARFENAHNRYGISPGKSFGKRLLDEAIGEYVEGGVTQYFKTFGDLMAAQKAGTAPNIIDKLRKEYNSSMKANRESAHGYWEIPSNDQLEDEGPRKARNVDVKLGKDALDYADSYTGLTGDFDKDFTRQLASISQPSPAKQHAPKKQHSPAKQHPLPQKR